MNEAQDPNKRNFYVGIDLGTTNSLMAWGTVNPRTNQIEPKIVPINMMIERGGMGKRELLPSYVYLKENSEPIVGEYAKYMIGRQTERVVKSIKSEMGTSKQFTFDDKNYQPAEISSLILTHLAQAAKSLFGFIPDDVVITVPASFDSDMRNDTIEAAQLAGFKITEDDGSPRNILLDEPRAALYDFINRQNKGEIPETLIDFSKPKLILVFDLGGGTLDVSLHRINLDADKQSVQIEDLAISRYTKVGGDNFDQLLADRFMDYYCEKIPPNLDDFQMNLLRRTFLQYAEQAKIDLSDQIENMKLMGHPDFSFVDTQIIQTPFENRVFDYELTLEEYEEVISPLLANDLSLDSVEDLDRIKFNENIIYPILDVLQKGKTKIGFMPKADGVLLNGGMTKLYSIHRRLEEFFGFPPIAAGDPDKAVARGATVYHYDLHRGIKPARILNDTIGIQVVGGIKHLVEAGTVLPLDPPKPIENLVVGEDGSFLELPFYLGSRKDTHPPNRKIARRQVKFQRPIKEGEPIFIQVKVDERGIMTLDGWPKANPDEKFTVTVISEGKPETQEPLPTAPETPGPKEKKPPVHENELNVNNTIQGLERHFDSYMKTYGLQKKPIMAKIKGIESAILQASNSVDFIQSLLMTIDYVNNFGKGRILILLGDLVDYCSGDDLLYDICDKAMSLSHPDQVEFKHPTVVKTVVRYAVEAIGKTGLSLAESHLIGLLNKSVTAPIRNSIIHSIGKISNSINAVQHLKPLIKSTSDADRIAVNWALGRIGSREKKESLPIETFDSIITILLDRLEREEHSDAKRNCIYALGEICDRRALSKEVVSEQKSAEVIRVLELFLTPQKISSLSGLGRLQQNEILQKFAQVSINMTKGIQLSQAEERNLLAIRTLLT
jgi:molecular chaperone DnaK (HSP70)